ncbi:MAG TPA: DUF6328 family protein [Rhodoglobus sp.]|nr:DUF6328 family protein [Rhodoglobus sp.]
MSIEADSLPGDGRNETLNERMDRNWNEILQELRVIQTGTQILTGFLLAVAFQQRFEDLDRFQVSVYLVLVALSVLATLLALAPVSLHRTLFRKRAKPEIVRAANRLVQLTLVVVALTLAGTALLIFDFVVGRSAGLAAGAVTAVVALLLWGLLPLVIRRNDVGA